MSAAPHAPSREPGEARRGAESTLVAVAIVPARLGSTRLARKMLRRDTGRYLFEHTARNAARAGSIARVVVATDAEEVRRAAEEVGLEPVMTSPHHASGTDRVREAFERLGTAADVVINVQGDEPELEPAALDAVVAAFRDPDVEIATLSAPVEGRAEALAPSVVKVVTDARGDALYFSRSCIPSLELSRPGAPGLAAVRRHVGVYAFRPETLRACCDLPPGELELTENLEQLRWLAAGHAIRVVGVPRAPAGIDTEEDYAAFVARHAEGRRGR